MVNANFKHKLARVYDLRVISKKKKKKCAISGNNSQEIKYSKRQSASLLNNSSRAHLFIISHIINCDNAFDENILCICMSFDLKMRNRANIVTFNNLSNQFRFFYFSASGFFYDESSLYILRV